METVPADLKKALAANAKALALWKGLTPIARRDFASWITRAKQEETRKRRVGRVADMLLSGKRRPCCYAVVPMGLYAALAKAPRANKRWKELTPDERRDFNDWVNAAKGSKEEAERIRKACALLAAGKRQP
jgi:uncharacterized protein YdeI (YjbR/CyaY-like superfamily)